MVDVGGQINCFLLIKIRVLILLRLSYTLRGVSRPSNAVRPV